MKLFRKTVILVHRYLGIGSACSSSCGSPPASSMMYAGGMPRLTPELRLERLPPLDLSPACS